MPLRSSGCYTCRKRKIRCDETRPHCKRCATHGVACPGYRTDKAGGIEFKDQTTETVTKAKGFYRAKDAGAVVVRVTPASSFLDASPTYSNGGASPPAMVLGENLLHGLHYRSLDSSPEDILSPTVNRMQLYDSFMDVYLPKNTSKLDHFSFFQTLSTVSADQPALTEALDALSLVAIGGMSKDQVVLNQAVSKYGKALGSLMKAVSRPDTAANDEVLAAATVLASCALYDEIGKHENAWGSHVTGGQQLIAARGPKSLKSKLALLLFSNTRHGALVWSLIQRKAPYMALPEWREVAFDPQIFDSSTLFYDAAIQIPGLLERYDQLGGSVALSTENCDAVLRDAEAVEQSLKDWFFDWELRFAFQGEGLYDELPIESFPTFTASISDRTFTTAFWFREFPIAYLASVYWLSMYHLRSTLQALHKLRHDLDGTWFPDPAQAVPEEEVSTYVTNLCRTIPFFAEPISSSTGHVGMFLPLTTSATYFVRHARWAEARWVGVVRASVFTRGLSPPSLGGTRVGVVPPKWDVGKLALMQHEKMFPWKSARDTLSPVAAGLSSSSSSSSSGSSPAALSPAAYAEAVRRASSSPETTG